MRQDFDSSQRQLPTPPNSSPFPPVAVQCFGLNGSGVKSLMSLWLSDREEVAVNTIGKILGYGVLGAFFYTLVAIAIAETYPWAF